MKFQYEMSNKEYDNLLFQECNRYSWNKMRQIFNAKSINKDLAHLNEFANCENNYAYLWQEHFDYLKDNKVVRNNSKVCLYEIVFPIDEGTVLENLNYFCKALELECGIWVLAKCIHKNEGEWRTTESGEVFTAFPNAHIVVSSFKEDLSGRVIFNQTLLRHIATLVNVFFPKIKSSNLSNLEMFEFLKTYDAICKHANEYMLRIEEAEESLKEIKNNITDLKRQEYKLKESIKLDEYGVKLINDKKSVLDIQIKNLIENKQELDVAVKDLKEIKDDLESQIENFSNVKIELLSKKKELETLDALIAEKRISPIAFIKYKLRIAMLESQNYKLSQENSTVLLQCRQLKEAIKDNEAKAEILEKSLDIANQQCSDLEKQIEASMNFAKIDNLENKIKIIGKTLVCIAKLAHANNMSFEDAYQQFRYGGNLWFDDFECFNSLNEAPVWGSWYLSDYVKEIFKEFKLIQEDGD